MIKKFTKHIAVNELSAVPKYLQISKSVMSAIEAGLIVKGQTIPSINDLSYELSLSRGTIEKSYQYLKDLKVISSFPGKGYYISKAEFKQDRKICLLFNNISARKKMVYDAFIETLGNSAFVDFFVYNNDLKHFERLLEENLDKYTHFVVLPHFINGEDQACKAINKIPKDKLKLLDNRMCGVNGDFGAVYENFERDIYEVFSKARVQLMKYHTIKMIFPVNSYYPKEIIKGFATFCRQYEFKYKVIDNIIDEPLCPGEVYVNLIDDDLVILIGRMIEAELKPGEDIGIISYNETPIKELLFNGITTISTDFKMLGAMAAQLILDNSKKHIAVPFDIKIRSSI
jgi:DNA-binding transcriptional regulator YhcF (GntR family)